MSAIKKIKAGSFAAACYEQNTLAELNAIVGKQADREDMQSWRISSAEWTEQVELAIEALEEKDAEK